MSTVKPAYKDQPWDPKKVAVIQRWSVFGGFSIKIDTKIIWLDLVWSLLTGDHYSEVAVNIGLDLCTIMYKVAYE
jgi:hypothetical protein